MGLKASLTFRGGAGSLLDRTGVFAAPSLLAAGALLAAALLAVGAGRIARGAARASASAG